MNRRHPRARSLLIAVSAACLLLSFGCVRRPPIATPHPYPDQQQGIEQTQKPARPVHQPASENSLAKEIRRQARDLVRQGRPEAAAQALERGLRIAPKDGWLWADLAEIRLKQGRFGQAATMARKAYALARNNPALRDRTRQIIQAAREKNSSIR